MINRRGFLQSILAAGVAPAVIGSGILMPVRTILVPEAAKLIISPEGAEGLNVLFRGYPKLMWPGIEAWYNKNFVVSSRGLHRALQLVLKSTWKGWLST